MQRIVTALVLIPAITYTVLWGPDPLFLLVLSAIAIACFYEYEGLVTAHGIERPGLLGYAMGLVLLLAGGQFTGALVALISLAISLRATNIRNFLLQASAMSLGVFYIFGAWRCAVDLRAASPWWLFFALALNWVGDIAAFYVGRTFGKHKLAERISPGKSWEGAIGSTIASMAFGAAYGFYVLPRMHQITAPNVPLVWIVFLAFAGNIAGQLGDLSESALKRGAGVKDSGNLLPGHGGWLDRVDSSLFSVPVVWVLLQTLERWMT